ncbi:hypothetical protein [Microbacterium enclense]|uniref:hypothetical protein n=1 Tax=Microbacterium enclense TaxID=993073 RepID=UPI003F7F4023
MAMGRPPSGIQTGEPVKVPMSPPIEAALDTLVAATGEAKTSHLRRAVTRYLSELGLLDAQRTAVTPTTTPKEKK